jgi:S-adenosylmethionine:tRNA ribosyltransferase-isomerase
MTTTAHRRAEAREPAEARGLARDEVRMLVAAPDRLRHARVRELAGELQRGDLLVVNNSATLPAALDAMRADGRRVPMHVGGELGDGRWVVELRRADQRGPSRDAEPGEALHVGSGVVLTLEAPYPDRSEPQARLWTARPSCAVSRLEHLWHHGRPVAYSYLDRTWPLAERQTIFAAVPGSAEMPSAGRPFTDRLVGDLARAGVRIAPVTLHCGLSSPEAHEPPGQPDPRRGQPRGGGGHHGRTGAGVCGGRICCRLSRDAGASFGLDGSHPRAAAPRARGERAAHRVA